MPVTAILLAGIFVPPEDIRRLRTHTRYRRDAHVLADMVRTDLSVNGGIRRAGRAGLRLHG